MNVTQARRNVVTAVSVAAVTFIVVFCVVASSHHTPPRSQAPPRPPDPLSTHDPGRYAGTPTPSFTTLPPVMPSGPTTTDQQPPVLVDPDVDNDLDREDDLHPIPPPETRVDHDPPHSGEDPDDEDGGHHDQGRNRIWRWLT